MITQAHIKNYKSIRDLTLKLGRITVLIGENGCGKSNILEALAFASAASQSKLDNEFLVSRGIRVTEPLFMRSAFTGHDEGESIQLEVSSGDDISASFRLINDNNPPYGKWTDETKPPLPKGALLGLTTRQTGERKIFQNADAFIEYFSSLELKEKRKLALGFVKVGQLFSGTNAYLPNFLIFAPENTSLRNFASEGQIQPLGIKGEGLFKLLKYMSAEENKERLSEIKENLRLIDWFGDLRVAHDLAPFEQTLQIKDRYLAGDLAYFDQRSANEGFLFLLFYFSLFIAKETPSFFAIDNIDASLNPKLCSELIKRLNILAKEHNKQVIITTHNPAILDGLNLDDEEQRLCVVSRNRRGETRLRRVSPPESVKGEPPIKLSEAFLRGLIGGLPQNF